VMARKEFAEHNLNPNAPEPCPLHMRILEFTRDDVSRTPEVVGKDDELTEYSANDAGQCEKIY